MPSLNPTDTQLLQIVSSADPTTIADVIAVMQNIDQLLPSNDGLKWFNKLYLMVTQQIDSAPLSDGWEDAAWLTRLDVVFAGLYFAAITDWLKQNPDLASSWEALFEARNRTGIDRIQFALAGMNAHINHDLPQAVVDTCQETSIPPQHGTNQYNDFTALNTTLDSMIESAKKLLRVRLLGDELPPVSALDDTLAAWSVAAAREAAWNNAELIWHLSDAPLISSAFLGTLDGLTAVASKALLVPV